MKSPDQILRPNKLTGSRMSGAKLLRSGLVAFLLGSAVASAEDLKPTRTVQENVLISDHEPAVRIELPKEVGYVGGDRWHLYNIADCELHVFVEADEQKRVKRLYWLQFEGYLPTKPDKRYNYANSPRKITWEGLEFLVRARFSLSEDKPKAGSDSERVQQLLRAQGYRIAAEEMQVRLVHLLDEQRRRELMITYVEDLALSGVSVMDLSPGGTAHDRWPAMSEELIQRARKAILIQTIQAPDKP